MFKKISVLVLVICFVFAGVFAEYIPFNVSLTSTERLNILNLLPKQSNVMVLRTARKLELEMMLTDEEKSAMGMKIVDGIITNLQEINWSAVPEKEYILGEFSVQLIIEELKKLDRTKQLQIFQLSIYDKFITNPEIEKALKEKEKLDKE